MISLIRNMKCSVFIKHCKYHYPVLEVKFFIIYIEKRFSNYR